jgi:hypothetical protein
MNVIDFEKARKALEDMPDEMKMTSDFISSALGLCKEISARGAKGEPVSPTEDRFMATFIGLMIAGLMGGARK